MIADVGVSRANGPEAAARSALAAGPALAGGLASAGGRACAGGPTPAAASVPAAGPAPAAAAPGAGPASPTGPGPESTGPAADATLAAGRMSALAAGPSLLAVSDLHVGHAQNRPFVEGLVPANEGDWLIVAGDVGEFVADIEWALGVLSSRFAKVIWAPGNHELWTHPRDASELRGVERYDHLVAMCRRLGVLTPEDPYPVWDAATEPVAIAPLFLLYDYTFRPDGANTKAEALEQAYATGIVCTDEMLLHPDPYSSIDAWCEARLELTERRLSELPAGTQTILVNHFPLVREPTRV